MYNHNASHVGDQVQKIQIFPPVYAVYQIRWSTRWMFSRLNILAL